MATTGKTWSKATVSCPRPEHAGSRVRLDGRYGKAGHRRQLYRCVPGNGERTNRLLLTMQLHANRQDDVPAYTKSIRAWLEPNGGRPRVARRAVTDPGGRASLR